MEINYNKYESNEIKDILPTLKKTIIIETSIGELVIISYDYKDLVRNRF